uniref:Si:dkey-8l13.5 n=1 Tax=Cyprinus carpio TaxID=7962 RepID=A0A8C2B7I5_CYPCA
MSSSPQVSHSQSVLPLFMGKGRNVTFALDSSVGMNGFLGSVKNLIIQTLITKASLRDSLFNIISFSYKSTPWSSHMMPCTPDVVYEALSWIHTLQTSPGRDLHSALALAFSDPVCQSVHLVTSGLPDNPPQCLASLSTLVMRPVNTFYIPDKTPMNTDVSDFLQCITTTTRGSCYVMTLNSSGNVDQLSLLHSTDDLIQKPSYSEDPCHSVNFNHVPFYNCTSCVCSLPCWCSPMNPFSTVSCVSARVMRGAELFPGCRVLDRREIDGFYYLGTIIHQGRGNLYAVEFDKFGSKRNTFMDTLNTVQPICQPDMVSLASAHRHSIVPGDTVLAPWEPDMRRYGPGRVISGMELRDPLKSDEGLLGLHVLFWNGMTIHVPRQLAVWIPASHYEQIIKDHQHYSSWPCCSRVSHCGTMNCFELPCQQCNHHRLSSIPPCHCPVKRCWPMFMSSPILNNQRRDELKRKLDLQLKELQSSQQTQVPSCSSSSTSDTDENEEDTAAEKHRPSRSELVSRSINTDISCLRKPYTQPETKPDWRYWKRGSAEPQHKKPGRAVRSPNVSHSWPRDTGNSGSSTDNTVMTNHSSLFKMVPDSPKRERGVNMREIFGSAQGHLN